MSVHIEIDTAMAAVVLGVTRRRIRQMVEEGKLTNYGTPRRIVLRLDEVSRLPLVSD